jgi:tetratricopeptide (TPR) repeat protein/predicted Ser/Thr protein kinase
MPSLHERAAEVFLAALSRPAAERDAFLVDACASDDALLREVGSLLLFHADGDTAGAGPAAEADPFSAGDLFAGRYRMIVRVGRGGMGDVWRADDLVLATPVALKLIRSASPSARARILQEVRLARQITHPAVCRVFDVGEAGETIFFSMEYVPGEDLAALLRRTGRLTSERVVEIAHQLCGGLAAAHAQGVLHRDLKPANILIDQDGRVRITDFGIAVTTRDAEPHAMIGTLGYMAPEQLVPDTPLTERTDLYALGVVLYELVTGRGHRATAGAAAPSPLAPGVDVRLERAILKSLSPDPEDRAASAIAMAAELPAIGTSPVVRETEAASRWTRMRWWIASAAAIAAGAAAVFIPRGAPSLTTRDTIVLTDFHNTTGEPVFDGTLNVALAVALEQSPFLKVFPADRVRDDLRLMQHPADTAVTEPIARQIAQRERFKALIASSIAGVGRNYVVALEAINAETGDVMARQQVEVRSKEEVLTALGSAASKLRQALGESLTSIERYDVPLPRATTPSLEALHAYALALDRGTVRPRLEAIPHLQRAIELDPNFALALALLSGTYANTGQTALAPEFSRQAYELRDRVTERERYFIAWRYYRDATAAWDKALETARAWTAAYPRESFAFNSLGFAAVRLGRYQESLEPFRESLRLDPRFVAPWQNLVAALTALNQYDEAKKVIAEARAAGIDYIGLRAVSYLVSFVGNDQAAMTREVEAARADPQAPWASNWEPRAAAFGGRIASAHDGFHRSVVATSQAHQPELAGLYTAQDADVHSTAGQCAEARREATDALGLSRDEVTLWTAGRALAWCGAAADARSVASELAKRFPEAIMATGVMVPVIAAATAIQAKQPARALELLDPVRRFDHAPAAEFWPAYLRGHALSQLGRDAEAAGEFRSVTEHRGERPDSALYPLAQLGLARALASTGDRGGARQAYEAFFTFWKDADPALAPLKEARLAIARLPR